MDKKLNPLWKDCEGNKTQYQCLQRVGGRCEADVLRCVYNSSRSFSPECATL